MAFSDHAPVGTAGFFDISDIQTSWQTASNELALLKYVHEHPSIATIRGNPAALAAVIEEFEVNTTRGLMTIGPKKRDHIINLFAAAAGTSNDSSIVFLEFGAYVGYSAVALGAALRDHNPGRKVSYFSFEKSPLMAAITSSFVELAGLKDVIHVNVGPASESVTRLAADGTLAKGSIDFMLIDHWSNLYISDLQICEALGLLKPGTVVLADNILFPGAPDYLAYVQRGTAEKSTQGLRYETQTPDFVMSRGQV
ncbi:hypothetical protein MMC07_009654, partial [Pseudocyphellaria aurata]|nr:hypothetical protein [Pseudocyphellaria aurata]